MQANEFEKNVQRTMDEFKLRTSDEVWQKVEERIQEKKKKRRILFFILLSFIGLALAGYGIYNFSKKRMTLGDESVAVKKLTDQKNNLNNATLILPEKSDASNKLEKKQEKLVNRDQNRNRVVATKTKISKLNDDLFIAEKKYPVKGGFVKMNKREPDKDLNSDSIIVKNGNISAGNESQFLTDEGNKKIVTDSVRKDVAINNFVDTASIKNSENNSNEEKAVVKKEKTKNQHSRKLQWGINVSAGSSVITEDRFSFKSSSAQADLSYNSPGSFPSGGGLTPYPPSANQSVFAFKAGVVIRKEISRRSKLSAGLQYAYLGDRIKAATTQTQTGTQQSNSSSGLFSYYRAIPQKTYTDRFHFIELPVTYSWRINRNTKHFLSLNVGTSMGYVFATNALTYDTSFGGIYFHNKSFFAKTHLNMISGISYHLAAAKKLEWSIGPQFSFDISKIIKSNSDKRKYFLFGGIDARIFFEKKKKK
jgi:hypothetical protein